MRGEDAEEPPADPADPGSKHAVSVLLSFGKCLLALLPVYLAGYFGFSLTLVLFGLAVYLGWKQHRDDKKSRLNGALYLQENEKLYTSTRVYKTKRELPAWVRGSLQNPFVYRCVGTSCTPGASAPNRL